MRSEDFNQCSGNDYLMKITFDKNSLLNSFPIKWEWLFDEDYFRLSKLIDCILKTSGNDYLMKITFDCFFSQTTLGLSVGMIIWWRLLSTLWTRSRLTSQQWEWLFDEDYFRQCWIFVYAIAMVKWEWLFDEDYFRLNWSHDSACCAVGMIIWWRLLSTLLELDLTSFGFVGMIIWWRLLSTFFKPCVHDFLQKSGNDYLMKITFDIYSGLEQNFEIVGMIIWWRLLSTYCEKKILQFFQKWEWLFDEDYFRPHPHPWNIYFGAVGMIIWWRLLSTEFLSNACYFFQVGMIIWWRLLSTQMFQIFSSCTSGNDYLMKITFDKKKPIASPADKMVGMII